MQVGAVIVAAGMSSRMGEFKPMLQIGKISIVQRIITNFQQANVSPIVVVTGHRAKELEKHIAKLGVICVRNEKYEQTEMVDSAKIGFSYIVDKCDKVFFTPVDIPLFTMNTLNQLLETDCDVAKPVYQQVDGHPILIKREVLLKVLKLDGEKSLKNALSKCAQDIKMVCVQDDGILHDVDTPKQYRELLEQHNKQLFRPLINVSLMREKKLIDGKTALLLYLIDYSGTVKEACEKAGISYSNAWGIIADLEENLGYHIIYRQPGGKSGGGSNLTVEGRDLLTRYQRYVDDVNKYANRVLCRYFEAETDV